MKKKILKMIRCISFMPFIVLILLALYNAKFGLPAFINSTYYGYQAFMWTIIAYGISYAWIEIICICIIVITSVMLYKLKHDYRL